MYFRLFIIGVLFVSMVNSSVAQQTSNNRSTFNYSFYLNKKLNYRWYLDSYHAVSFGGLGHHLWYTHNDVSIMYRFDRFWSVKGSVAWARYKGRNGNFLNMSNFFITGLALQHRREIFDNTIRLENTIKAQYVIPKFRRYQTRFQYRLGATYNKKDLPLRMRPFIQGTLYYYLAGKEATYYEEGDDGGLAKIGQMSPNGLHRFQIRVGTHLRLSKKVKLLRNIKIFYAYNREFNTAWGNPLNYEVPSTISPDDIVTRLPFNNYHSIGIQVNLFMR